MVSDLHVYTMHSSSSNICGKSLCGKNLIFKTLPEYMWLSALIVWHHHLCYERWAWQLQEFWFSWTIPLWPLCVLSGTHSILNLNWSTEMFHIYSFDSRVFFALLLRRTSLFTCTMLQLSTVGLCIIGCSSNYQNPMIYLHRISPKMWDYPFIQSCWYLLPVLNSHPWNLTPRLNFFYFNFFAACVLELVIQMKCMLVVIYSTHSCTNFFSKFGINWQYGEVYPATCILNSSRGSAKSKWVYWLLMP